MHTHTHCRVDKQLSATFILGHISFITSCYKSILHILQSTNHAGEMRTVAVVRISRARENQMVYTT
ncbi:unnamed protein product [Acanthoscelides obtectus]|uniref:Uncharacterized protein n=1 Tax=Acanthoscelides obtectus TaxID=200917 RepID=A0A9P0PM05_ACAOB|nr:unnamed protein product [Acanthoscelides obtectus]CAK1656819.1 hypothetical protein AOBTE_LOCUS19933 [Acanthoscelides obtectus]